MAEDRFANQKRLIDENLLGQTRFVVVGAGAIGSTFTTALAKMGARNITVYDFDTLENHNFANQMHPISQLGKAKVDSLAHSVLEYGECKITAINQAWTPDNAIECDILVMCVDNMDVRKALWDYYRTKCNFIIDGRMGAYVAKCYSIAVPKGTEGSRNTELGDTEEMAYYAGTLIPHSLASEERCGEKSIIYTVFGVSCLMLSQIRDYLCNDPYRPTEIIYDVLNHTMEKKCFNTPEMEIVHAEDHEVEAASQP